MVSAQPDPIEHIHGPDDLRRMLTEVVRRSDLLRQLLRFAQRKATYDHSSVESANPKEVLRG